MLTLKVESIDARHSLLRILLEMTPLFERQHQQLGRLTAVEQDPKFCSGLNKGSQDE